MDFLPAPQAEISMKIEREARDAFYINPEQTEQQLSHQRIIDLAVQVHLRCSLRLAEHAHDLPA